MPVSVTVVDSHVGVVEFSRPPHNFFDAEMLEDMLGAYRALAGDAHCRAIVLCSSGNHFCAGANFRAPGEKVEPARHAPRHLYDIAADLFAEPLPVIAAVQGAAVGGGLGLALSADFRVMTPSTRLAANFSHIGFHQGFGISVTLPRLVGQQRALDMLYNSRDIRGEAAFAAGLCEKLVAAERLRETAIAMGSELARAAPLAVRAIRRTMRGGVVDEVRAAMRVERSAQELLRETDDFRAGVAAPRGELPQFNGR